MFSRNRSAQLLEQPLLSRFAPDIRRRTRAFAYKPHHKIHNTSPRRAITTEDRHRSREFMQNRGGDSLADRRFSKQNPSSSHRLVPFSSLASGSIAKLLRAFPELAPPLPSARRTDRPLPRALNEKAGRITYEQAKEKLPLGFIGDTAPDVGRPQANATPNFPLTPTKKGRSERETTNALSKVRRKERRKGLKKKERRRPPHPSCGETVRSRGFLPNKWRL